RWLATFFGIFLALAIAFVMIWIAYKPQVRTSATEQTEQAGVALAPSPSATPETLPSSAESAPVEQPQVQQPPGTQEPEKDKGDGDGGDKGGGGGGGGESKKPKPPVRTAATAVKEVAARSEGRHICYRAYVADQGWQAPVCDGAEAGTVGKNLPIKALNIAVSGTKGVTGNGAHVVEAWLNGSKWESVPDQTDMYLGSTKEAVSPMEGFTLKTVEGTVCPNTHVKDKGWLKQGCTEPGAWRYFGSNMENDRLQLEAVRITV
ncbi:hydrolase, partial [Streptomyces sp. ME02-6977A]|nr:hydrolase [Streptomyces sp. ME02-6977A]